MIDLSSLKDRLHGKPIAIAGLGLSGRSVLSACQRAGLDVVVWDDRADIREGIEKEGVAVRNLAVEDLSSFAFLVLSPGISLLSPVAQHAQKNGCPVIGDVELFHVVYPEARTIGITGTNGKSTTTALIHHVVQSAGVETAMGGNIGLPVLDLPALSVEGLYIFELSSYQLDLCDGFSPDISILINIAPDHLDHHGGMEAYVAAKERIFRGGGVAVFGVDDQETRNMYGRVKTQVQRSCVTVSVSQHSEGDIYVAEDGVLYDKGKSVIDLTECQTLRGTHNWQNAAIAYAACRTAGISVAAIVKGLKTFLGLAHRQYVVSVKNGVSYINDSKATNDPAAAMALAAYDTIYWIAGGQSKHAGYDACATYLKSVRHAFLIGEAAEEMAAWLSGQGIPFTLCGVLEEAVSAAHVLAQNEKISGSAVLLSPACASWDQFKSFEHRGDVFAACVQALVEDEEAGLG